MAGGAKSRRWCGTELVALGARAMVQVISKVISKVISSHSNDSRYAVEEEDEEKDGGGGGGCRVCPQGEESRIQQERVPCRLARLSTRACGGVAVCKAGV